jgi:hypothetical protein
MKSKRIIKSVSALLLAAVTLVGTAAESVQASELPYTTYNYNYWDDIVYTPAAYEPNFSVSGNDLTYNGEPIGAFSTPQDLCVSPDGLI